MKRVNWVPLLNIFLAFMVTAVEIPMFLNISCQKMHTLLQVRFCILTSQSTAMAMCVFSSDNTLVNTRAKIL